MFKKIKEMFNRTGYEGYFYNQLLAEKEKLLRVLEIANEKVYPENGFGDYIDSRKHYLDVSDFNIATSKLNDLEREIAKRNAEEQKEPQL